MTSIMLEGLESANCIVIYIVVVILWVMTALVFFCIYSKNREF